VQDTVDVPEGIVRRLRLAVAHLPEIVEEHPRDDVRWRIRGQTMANVRTVVQPDGRLLTAVTFHSRGEEHDALLAIGHPFSRGWGDGLIALVLTDDDRTTDWQEVKELLTESYCYLAPKKLIARLEGR
jgi:hypothetical protein